MNRIILILAALNLLSCKDRSDTKDLSSAKEIKTLICTCECSINSKLCPTKPADGANCQDYTYQFPTITTANDCSDLNSSHVSCDGFDLSGKTWRPYKNATIEHCMMVAK